MNMHLEISNVWCRSVSDDTTSRLFKSSITNFDPTAITTKDTIRALTAALEACGMTAKIEA